MVRTTTANLVSILSNKNTNIDTNHVSTTHVLPDDGKPLQLTNTFNRTALVDNRVEPRCDSNILDTVQNSTEVHHQIDSDNKTFINKIFAKSKKSHATTDFHRLSNTKHRRKFRSSSKQRSQTKSITSKSRSTIIDSPSSNIYITNVKPSSLCSSKPVDHHRNNNDSIIIVHNDDNINTIDTPPLQDSTELQITKLDSKSKDFTHQRRTNDSKIIITNDNNLITTNVAPLPTSKLHNKRLDSLYHHPPNDDPNIILNNDDDIVITNTTPSIESTPLHNTRLNFAIDNQSSAHQPDSLSIDELKLFVQSSKNYISKSLKQASTTKNEINKGNLESKTMLHSINNAITHCQLDINTLTRTRSSILSDTVSLNKHCKLVRNLNTDSQRMIDNINNTIFKCRSEQDNINSIHNTVNNY